MAGLVSLGVHILEKEANKKSQKWFAPVKIDEKQKGLSVFLLKAVVSYSLSSQSIKLEFLMPEHFSLGCRLVVYTGNRI